MSNPHSLQPPPAERLETGIVRSPEELDAVQRFRYRILRDAGRPTDEPLLDHATQRHRDPLDEHLHVVFVRQGPRIVGTFRWGVASWTAGRDRIVDEIRQRRPDLGDPEGFRLGRSDRMVIDPSGPGRHALSRMSATALDIALNAGCHTDLCWCAPHLAGLYGRLGFTPLDLVLHTEDGRPLTAMSLDLLDVTRLERMRSPLLRARHTSAA